MTAAQIRKEVEVAKAEAMRNYERNHGAGSIERLAELRKGNAKALESICAAIAKARGE